LKLALPTPEIVIRSPRRKRWAALVVKVTTPPLRTAPLAVIDRLWLPLVR
jgi:hypothetical protein